MDITDFQDFGSDVKLTNVANVKFPSSLEHNKTVSRLFGHLKKENMQSNLEHFTSFHTRYYKSEYGQKSSAWLLEQVKKIVSKSGAMENGASVRPFSHPWGQSSIIAQLPGRSNKTVVIGAHQDSINLLLPS